MLDTVLAQFSDIGLLILRVTVGIIFILHGYPKMPFPNSPTGGPRGFGAGLAKMGIPFPGFFAWTVAILEFVGGFLLIVGFATRLIALLMAINMVVAIKQAKIGMMKTPFIAKDTTGWEFDFALLGASLALFLLGPGNLALHFGLGL
ncbi:MAG: DoxX family protein [Chloroflexi bacterium]|nr:DoxX family protein [Chloroflexota bacterium]